MINIFAKNRYETFQAGAGRQAAVETSIAALMAGGAGQAREASAFDIPGVFYDDRPMLDVVPILPGGVADNPQPIATNPPPSVEMNAFVPDDTLFSNQLHLQNNNVGQFDLNVVDAWDDYTGAGVRITVIDDGVDSGHPDLSPNYNTGASRQFQEGVPTVEGNGDPIVSGANDRHGTAVAGIAAAAQNGTGVVGVAYESELVSYYSDYSLDAMDRAIAQAVADANTDVVNMSFGTRSLFNDDADYVSMVSSFESGVATGRGGDGIIWVKSAGNDRGSDDTNAELRDASWATITVAAVDYDGDVSSYSTPGASVTVSGFGTPSDVYTTDRTGTDGYRSGDFMPNFNGTSAAAPMVAGVASLMLEANPDLGWRDVQTILAYSARHVGSDVGSAATGSELSSTSGTNSWLWNDASNWNGGGLHFSNDYGFGLVDAKAAVRLAETWELDSTSSNRVSTFADLLNTTVTVDEGAGTSFTGTETQDILIEHVTVQIDFSGAGLSDVGDLELYLTSPSGTESLLYSGVGGTDAYTGRWDFGSNAFRGETSAGTWTVRLVDQDDNSTSPIVISDIDIYTYGSTITSDDLYIFTNEYSDYDGVAGHVTSFNGSIGVNTINAAAVDSNTTLNFLADTGTIDGVSVSVLNIDRAYTGDGNDTLIGDGIATYLNAGRGSDDITGASSDDELLGEDGNDTLEGGGGDDTLRGGDGDDTFRYAGGVTFSAGETILGGLGNDRILITGAGTFDFDSPDLSVSSIEEFEFDFVVGQDKTAIFTGKELDQTVEVPSDFRLDGNAGGIDTFIVNIDSATGLNDFNASGWLFMDWADGTDILRFNGDSAANEIQGTSRRDEIFGNGGIDTLRGNGGNDLLRTGASGTFEMYGGADDDNLGFTSGTLTAGNTFDGEGGGDTFDFSGLTGDFLADLDAGTFQRVSLVLPALPSTLVSIENVVAGSGDDTLTGTSGANELIGNGGADSISGGDGADTIEGGDQNDTIEGGGGIDDIRGGAGEDLFLVNAGWTGGNEIIDGGGDDDKIDGSSLGSNYIIDLDAGEFLRSGFPFGTIQLISVEDAESGSGDDTLTGTSGANELIGNGGNDELAGGAGEDTLIGGADNDTLEGGAGQDSISGGDGDDEIRVDSTTDPVNTDQIDGGANTDKLTYSSAGADTVDLRGATITSIEELDGSFGTGATTLQLLALQFGAGIALDALFRGDTDAGADRTVEIFLDGLSNFSLANILFADWDSDDRIINNGTGAAEGITGSSQNDILRGDGGDDTISGGSGNDTLNGGADADEMAGGADDDTYMVDNVGDTVVELVGEGTDTVLSSLTSYTLDDHVERLELQGAAVAGTGNALVNTLVGNALDNTLNGAGGADFMVGGTGNDRYFVGAAGDRVIEYNGQGTDTVISYLASYTLGDHVERLELRGAAVIGTGNALANTLVGNGLDNTLNGAGGADYMVGRSGNDRYFVGAAGDIVVEQSGEGTDTVVSYLSSYTLTDHVERLELQGGAITGTGNALANTLVGNGLDNTLNGAGGADYMVGRTGNDRYFVGAAGDTVIEFSGEGTDTVLSYLNSYTLGDHVERMELQGAAVTGIGNALNNTLVGNALDNVLNGAAGADYMVGGNGDDRYFVAAPGDTVVEFNGQGTDTVISYLTSYTLGGHVERLELQGGAVNGTGNALANTLVGNGLDNILNGGAGADYMVGRSGNDRYIVGAAGDIVVEQSGEGTDTAVSYLNSYTLGAHVERLELQGPAVTGIGNALNNTLIGNAQDNTLRGEGGTDYIRGGAGADDLYGGAGADVFVYNTVTDSPAGPANRDTIHDFEAIDRIALSNIDANGTGPGNTAFTWLGTSGFTNTAGELRYSVFGSNSIVQADVDGDSLADMEILLQGYTALNVSDFNL